MNENLIAFQHYIKYISADLKKLGKCEHGIYMLKNSKISYIRTGAQPGFFK